MSSSSMNTVKATPMGSQAKENELPSPALTALLLAYYELAASAGEAAADEDDDMPPELIDVSEDEVKALQEEYIRAAAGGVPQLSDVLDASKSEGPQLCGALEDEESLFVPRASDAESPSANAEGAAVNVEGAVADADSANIELAGADENTAPTYLNDTDAESDWDDAIHGGMRNLSKGKVPANPLLPLLAAPLGDSAVGNGAARSGDGVARGPLGASAANLSLSVSGASLPLLTTAIANVAPSSLFSIAVDAAAARDPIPLLAALAPPMPAFFVHSATPQAAPVRRKRGSQK